MDISSKSGIIMTLNDQERALFLAFILRQYYTHLVRKELLILNKKG